jgi:hypothetical protein
LEFSASPALLRSGDGSRDVAESRCRRRRFEGTLSHRGGDLLVRVAERNPLANERLGGVGREQEWIGRRLGESFPVELQPGDENGECTEGTGDVLSRCEEWRLVLLQVLTTASNPVSRPSAVPAFPRASSATSGFSFCGIIDDPVAALSGSRAKANSRVVQSTSSSPIRDRCVKRTAAAYR